MLVGAERTRTARHVKGTGTRPSALRFLTREISHRLRRDANGLATHALELRRRETARRVTCYQVTGVASHSAHS